ncbi:thiol:disulfide interchange protein DsbA/DsbL [Sinimarinibacterium sp. NLF-5-8]|uniref:thiol:disulfide interchange protein DsbA/DsbL n=1 Tax=Sinimarinibacterium sp. NLF-5-8 TaxID=2698684 RepID=UPI00137C2BC8|nr:thiol:disulfide interchange protein DsbA/DsbL [Sinimarinibacterium sp. NLF-5-8]QHS10553.1 thiol:disulfide interchange protein DsbA/DsbL [Sinimarinibacterium sp. NLF-5-8]
MRTWMRGLSAAMLGLFAMACSAQDGATAKFEQGKQYQQVRTIEAPIDAKRIEVREFFLYSCPHCYHFDPAITAWEKTKAGDVDFVRAPLTFGREVGRTHAKAYYAADSLGILSKIHPALFNAFHEQHNSLASDQQVAGVFRQVAGIEPEATIAQLKSFTADAQVRKNDQQAMAFGVSSVPTVVVGGKYVTSPAMAGGFDEAVTVINFLIDKVRQERGGQ